MTDSNLFPIAILYAKGTGVDGATKFQKLVFLSQKEGNLDGKYDFHADNFGPYSPQLSSDIDYLIDEGYAERIVRTNEVGHEKHIFKLTDQGYKIAKKMTKKDKYEDLFQEAVKVKTRFDDYSLDDLLGYVYRKYPSYTIKSELDLERLFDPDAESQFLDPADSVGPSPEEGLEMNTSAEDAFSID